MGARRLYLFTCNTIHDYCTQEMKDKSTSNWWLKAEFYCCLLTVHIPMGSSFQHSLIYIFTLQISSVDWQGLERKKETKRKEKRALE